MAALARNVFVEIGNNIPSAVPQFEMNPLPPAWGDATLLRLVWLNLLSNAVKYSGKVQHPAVEIGGHIDGGEAIFYVKDNGTGFDMKYYDKLFRVFHRLHREEEYEGTGIGLATVQQVVTKHGGRVWGQGEVGRGATFYFTLPTGGDHG